MFGGRRVRVARPGDVRVVAPSLCREEVNGFVLPEFPAPEIVTDFLLNNGFDAIAYANEWHDLRALDVSSATLHFVRHGWREGRRPIFAHGVSEILRLLRSEWNEPWMQHVGRLAVGTAVWNAQRDCYREDMVLDLVALLAGDPHHIPGLMIGDSHVAFLTHVAPMMAAGILPAPILCNGASARGLGNPDSSANYGGLILQRLDELGSMLLHRPVLFKFGQVDIEFVFDMKRIRHGQKAYDPAAARAFIEQTVQRYAAFLDICRSRCRARIMVVSAFPPTLGDAVVQSGYVNAHIAFMNGEADPAAFRRDLASLDYPDLLERTALARYFNALLGESCKRLAMPFIEEFDALLGPDGTAHPSIANPEDHHIQLDCPLSRNRSLAVGRQIRCLAEL